MPKDLPDVNNRRALINYQVMTQAAVGAIKGITTVLNDYWSTKNEFANYNNLINWWTKYSHERHLYVGHAIYKLDERNRHSFKRS